MNVFAPVAVWGFWLLLVAGWLMGELPFKAAAILIPLWIAGVLGSTMLGPYQVLLIPYAAVLDIALVFIVFKGDVELK